MSNFFRRLPNLAYPTLLKTKQSNTDITETKDLFRRVKIREDLYANMMHFDKFKIIGDQRPDQVADEIYGSYDLDWVVLISNNIIDMKNEWPMTQYDLNTYLNEKYTHQELTKIHHYETVEFRARNNQLIVPAGLEVDEDWNMEYLQSTQIRQTNNHNEGRPLKSVSFFEYETRINDEKRNINMLKPELLDRFISEFTEIMKYEKSSQYVNRKLKKTENIRIH